MSPPVIVSPEDGDITTRYSEAELRKVIAAAERITRRGSTQSPTLTLTLVSVSARKRVGKLSERKKGRSAKRA